MARKSNSSAAGQKPGLTRTERLELRLTAEDKHLIVRAAETRGMKPSEYVLTILRKASNRTLEQVRILKYSRRDQMAMIEALLNPRPPNERLKRAWKNYERLVSKS